MKITNDGFIWKLLTEKEALAYHNDDHLGEVFLLFDDESETLAELNSDILEHNGEYGIEVGRPTEEQSFDVVLGVRRDFLSCAGYDGEPMDGDDTECLSNGLLRYANSIEGNI